MASHIKRRAETALPADLGTYLTEIINEEEKATCIKMSTAALFIIMENWTPSNADDRGILKRSRGWNIMQPLRMTNMKIT